MQNSICFETELRNLGPIIQYTVVYKWDKFLVLYCIYNIIRKGNKMFYMQKIQRTLYHWYSKNIKRIEKTDIQRNTERTTQNNPTLSYTQLKKTIVKQWSGWCGFCAVQMDGKADGLSGFFFSLGMCVQWSPINIM